MNLVNCQSSKSTLVSREVILPTLRAKMGGVVLPNEEEKKE